MLVSADSLARRSELSKALLPWASAWRSGRRRNPGQPVPRLAAVSDVVLIREERDVSIHRGFRLALRKTGYPDCRQANRDNRQAVL